MSVGEPRRSVLLPILGLGLGVATILVVGPGARPLAAAFGFVAHQFYEVPGLATLRRPTQISLLNLHLLILGLIASVGLIASPKLPSCRPARL